MMKTRLVQMISQAREEETQFVDSLLPEDRLHAGTPEKWAAKDLVAHLAFIRRLLAYRLGAVAGGQQPEPIHEPENLANEVFEANRSRSWEEILLESERSYQDLLLQIQKLDDEVLLDIDRFPWRKGRPVWQMVLIPAFVLPYYHLAHYYYRHGDGRRANFIQEQVAESLLELDHEPFWQARTRYNLACYYAITGQKERALARLKDALDLYPSLADYAQKDKDFTCLHQDPAFLALLEDLPGRSS